MTGSGTSVTRTSSMPCQVRAFMERTYPRWPTGNPRGQRAGHTRQEASMSQTDDTDRDQPVAVVIGASRGLGFLVAKELLTRGHRVVVAARDEAEVEAAAQALGKYGPVTAERCDVRDRHDVGELVGRVEHSVGPIEVLVTVAGVIQTAPLESLALHEFEDAMDTMAWGPIHAALTVLPHMRRRGRGHIGTVTSVGG